MIQSGFGFGLSIQPPFYTVSPFKVKGKIIINSTRPAFQGAFHVEGREEADVSATFSFTERNDVIWKLKIIRKYSTVVRVELILVSMQTVVPSVKGVIYISNPGHATQDLQFGPVSFREINYCLPINVQLSVDLFKGDLHVEMHYLEELISRSNLVLSTPDLSKFLFSQELSDVILDISGVKIPAHKVILSANSTYFRTTLQNSLPETQNQRIEILDVDLVIIKELLRYLYIGKVDQVEKCAAELMIAAHKFDISALQKHCRETLVSKLNPEMCVELLVLANCLDDDVLKQAVVNFTVLNLFKVMQSSGWGTLVYDHPKLMEDLLKAVSLMKLSPN